MDLKEKLDRQISLAVRDTVIRLSRGEAVDAGNLALAIASGQTAESLVKQAQEKLDSRAAATKSEPGVFVHPLTPDAPKAPTVGANRAPRPTAPAGPESGKPHPNPLSSKDFEKATHG